MQTVRDGINVMAREMGVAPEDFPEFWKVWIGSPIAHSTPERYQRLTEEVL